VYKNPNTNVFHNFIGVCVQPCVYNLCAFSKLGSLVRLLEGSFLIPILVD